jgi:hypothetical protein
MYKWSKVEGGALRFYNVIGRPLTLIMQQATQVLESDGSGSSRGNPVKHGRGFRSGDLDRRESVGKILRQKLKSHKPETKSSLSGTRTQGRKS